MITPHYTLGQLQNLNKDSAYYQAQSNFTNIRDRAIKQAAEALGMQAGLAHESKVIDGILQGDATDLNRIYRFQALMIRNNVLPPVIEKASNALNVGDQGQEIRIGGVSYQIIQQVRFVTAPPTWCNYLWMQYPEPRMPAKVLLPQNSKERQLWQLNVAKGWQEGIAQGLQIYKINLHRLVRDYTGMALYRKLLAEHMISPSAVHKTMKGITGNAQHMVIDDQVWKIVSKPQLQIHGKLWQPTLIHQSTPVRATQSVGNNKVEQALKSYERKTQKAVKDGKAITGEQHGPR